MRMRTVRTVDIDGPKCDTLSFFPPPFIIPATNTINTHRSNHHANIHRNLAARANMSTAVSHDAYMETNKDALIKLHFVSHPNQSREFTMLIWIVASQLCLFLDIPGWVTIKLRHGDRCPSTAREASMDPPASWTPPHSTVSRIMWFVLIQHLPLQLGQIHSHSIRRIIRG
mmetsp:Transcript_50621/g.74222  ORF Transcript_50621/g.74222 Transcript_50621/m.74222 type:complete len:171 (-) Transcript_50621:144-656(-)